MRNKHCLAGFALLEIAISLLILAIISSSSISIIRIMNKHRIATTTNENIKTCINALEAYCICNSCTTTDSLHTKNNENTIELPNPKKSLAVQYTILPYKQLEINESQAKNGKGEWLKYEYNPNGKKKFIRISSVSDNKVISISKRNFLHTCKLLKNKNYQKQ